MSKKVLLAYISDISGHRSAAFAVQDALKTIDPGVKISCLNLFNYTNPFSEKVVNYLYANIIKKAPKIWEYLYDNPKIVEKTHRIKGLIHKFNAKKLKILFDEFNPDVIACTQAFPCGMFADFKKIYGLRTPLVGIVTDFLPHAYWFYDNVDYYTIASEESRLRFIKYGISEEKIKLLGIPIAPKFSASLDKESIARKLGLDLSRPVVLVMGGGQGLGPINTIVKSIDGLGVDLQLLVVAGINTKLYNNLRKAAFRKKCLIFSYVNNIEELMTVSSVIVSKPGGLTISEAMAKGLACIIVSPIPGQEENNTQYLTAKNVAVRAKTPKDVSGILSGLLADKDTLYTMRKNTSVIARPDSALDIAKLLLDTA